MITASAGVKVHIALGVTDMRKGIDGLATLVQEILRHDPFSGHLFAFRGGKANLLKILYWDGTGLCLFTKRLDHGAFEWPTTGTTGQSVSLTSAQLSMLIERRLFQRCLDQKPVLRQASKAVSVCRIISIVRT